MNNRLMIKNVLIDITESIANWRLWGVLGWLEIRQRYRRSAIGPFWLTISMGVMIAALGVIYGTLFGVPLEEYLPMLACGLVFWNFINFSIQEGANVFISSSRFIHQIPNPFFVYVMSTWWRQVAMLAHNFVVIFAVLFLFKDGFNNNFFWVIPGFLLLSFNLMWMILLLGLVSVRFRDVPQVVASVMQVAFYVTPVLFQRELLSDHSWIVTINPFAHMLDIVREPLLYKSPSAFSFYFCMIMALVGGTGTLLLFGKVKDRIAYWA